VSGWGLEVVKGRWSLVSNEVYGEVEEVELFEEIVIIVEVCFLGGGVDLSAWEGCSCVASWSVISC
jgi:hypothetical protein